MTELKTDLQLFGANENIHGTESYINAENGKTTSYGEGGLSPEMKTYYSDYLIDNAEPALVHDMFAQKVNIPAGNGKTIQFRKYNPLPKLTTPMAEGVTPTGQTMNATTVNATVSQYGGYVEFTDMLLMSSIDNNLCTATKLLGSQAGRTLDTITREVLVGGTNVQYAEGQVSARHHLEGGNKDEANNHYLTVEAIRKAVRFLKKQNADKINGSYIAIIHPDCVYDLMKDENWRYPHQYAAPEEIFEGEIGKIEGVRFIESTEAKIFSAPDFNSECKVFTLAEQSPLGSNIYTVNESTEGVLGRYICFGLTKAYIGAVDGQKITLYTDRTCSTPMDQLQPQGAKFFPGEAGLYGRDVYATLIFGDNAFGTTSITGGGLEHIVKQLGSAGSADPLNQRASVGWKATKATVRLVEAFMVRIETTASANN